jgi:hypothetical protein
MQYLKINFTPSIKQNEFSVTNTSRLKLFTEMILLNGSL